MPLITSLKVPFWPKRVREQVGFFFFVFRKIVNILREGMTFKHGNSRKEKSEGKKIQRLWVFILLLKKTVENH